MKISELPEEYRKLAEKRKRSSSDYISSAFNWMETSEGYGFWFACDEAQTESELPPIPKEGEA